MKDKWFYTIALGFVFGVACHSFFSVPTTVVYALLLIFSAVLSFLLIFHGSKRALFFLIALFCFSFSAGLFRYSVSIPSEPSPLRNEVGKSITKEVVIVDEPDVREKSTLLTAQTDSGEKILLITERYPEYHYGEKIQIEGMLEKPKSFITDSGKEFDYAAYLGKDDIFYLLFRPRIILLGTGKGNIIKEKLLDLKSIFMERAGIYIPEPEISLLGGLLVGARHGLSEDMQTSFRNAGIIHIIVLSGYNITIVAEAIMALFAFLLLRFRLAIGASSIVLFAILTGGSSTVVRASLMALLVLLAQATRRTYYITRALIVAGLLMVFYNPKILIFDPSFELSFLATVGLIYLAPAVEKHASFIPTRFGFREFAVATIATQIFVLPLLLFMTGKISIISLLTNLLVLPIIPLTMLLGFTTGALALFSPLLSFPFAYATHLLLSYIIFIASLLGSVSWATVSVPEFEGRALIVSYAITALLLGLFWRRKRKNTA